MTTFAQAIYEGAKLSAEGASQDELKGLSKESFLLAMEKLTSALDQLPAETSLHVVLFAVTYLRNAIILTVQHNQSRLEVETGGSA